MFYLSGHCCYARLPGYCSQLPESGPYDMLLLRLSFTAKSLKMSNYSAMHLGFPQLTLLYRGLRG